MQNGQPFKPNYPYQLPHLAKQWCERERGQERERMFLLWLVVTTPRGIIVDAAAGYINMPMTMEVEAVFLLSKNAAITQLESISRTDLIELKRIESNRFDRMRNQIFIGA